MYDLDANGDPATVSSLKQVQGVGLNVEGAGIAIGDVDKNGYPDIILMGYDAPSGQNNFRYKIGYNLNYNGDVAYWGPIKQIGGESHVSEGSDVAVGDIDKDGNLDIVLMTQDAPSGPNQLRYKVGFNLNANGDAAYWSPTQFISAMSNSADGAGVALRDMNGDGNLDIILMSDDSPYDGPGFFLNNFRYKIGYTIGTNGAAASWSAMQEIPGLPCDADGAGIAFGDVDDNGTNDIFLMMNANLSGANYFKYRVGYSVNSAGYATGGWK